MSICEELQDLIPAYVLDALDDADRSRVESHLPHCPQCAQVAQSLQPVSDLLAYAAAPAEPRAELRYRVLAAVSQRTPRRPENPSRAAFLSRLLSWFNTPALSAAALLLVLAFGLWNLRLQDQIAQQAADTRRVSVEMARQQDALIALAYNSGPPRHLQGTDSASRAAGRLYGGYDENSFVMVAYEMPALPTNRVYQLWLIDQAGNRISGGLFQVDDRGRGWLIGQTPKPLGEYRSAGVTVEPVGGSPGPTGAKMLGGNL